MQRRVNQPDRHRQAVHLLQNSNEVLTLQGQERLQCSLALSILRRQDQPFDECPAFTQEHVLGAQQPDTLSAHAPSARGVFGSVRIRANAQPANLVSVIHDSVH